MTSVCSTLYVSFFNPKIGNIIEWCDSSTHDLNGIECLSIGAGFQHSTYDYVLFRHPNNSHLWSGAAFNLLRTDNSEERFCRARSVGVLAEDLGTCRSLLQFLLFLANHLNNYPGQFDIMEYASHCLKSQSTPSAAVELFFSNKPEYHSVFNSLPVISQKRQDKDLLIQCPTFLVLWRAILCRQRVLLFARKYAGLLCEFGLDLLSSAGVLVEDGPGYSPETLMRSVRALLYRTSMFEPDTVLQDRSGSWLVATTDIALVEGALPWEVLVVFDSITSSKVDRVEAWDRESHLMHHCTFKLVSGERMRMTIEYAVGTDARIERRTPLADFSLWRRLQTPLSLNVKKDALRKYTNTLFSVIAMFDSTPTTRETLLFIVHSCRLPLPYISWLHCMCEISGLTCPEPPESYIYTILLLYRLRIKWGTSIRTIAPLSAPT